MAYFQFVFAAITMVIMAGAFLCRMHFVAWMIFVPFWLTFSYTIGAFSLWRGGFLSKMGVIDFSGGYVIHLSSGTAGYVGAWWLGERLGKDRKKFPSNNVLLMLVGAGILWIGWNGFNGGDPYKPSADAGAAVLNTNVATATSLLVWTVLDLKKRRKPSVIGAVQGMFSGLVAITPGAGVVNTWGAVIIGILSGSIPWGTLHYLKILRKVDDTLRVFDIHAVAGFVGGFSVGLFATAEGCAAFGVTSPGGAIEGNWKHVWLQLVGAIFIFVLNVVITSIIFAAMKYTGIPLSYPDDILEKGDNLIHDESAYAMEDEDEVHGSMNSSNDASNAGGNVTMQQAGNNQV